MPTVQIAELFYSIQGEGASCGRATAFIRLGGCTLGCQWCDTKYSWPGGKPLEQQHILETIQSFPARRVVVTGGEPFEQDIATLLQALKQAGYTIEIETAGFAPLAQVRCAALADQLNVSPKLANAGLPYTRRIHLPVLQFLRDTGKAYFKFVIEQPTDVAEVDALVSTLALSPERVLLMPQALTPEDVLSKSRWLIEECKTRGYGYSPRLHILLWGAKRGV
ncbi:MAG: 7-carboxy-7-deazaguanine synthase QueE [Candidatus Tectimicrobiota bacterium]